MTTRVAQPFRAALSVLVAGLALIAATGQTPAPTITLTQPAPVTYNLTAQDERFLGDLSNRSYTFFSENADPVTGIVRDRARTDGSPHKEDRRWVGSIASTGFGLAALCIAADRGWSQPAQARQRARATLATFADRLYNNPGWFHHFIDIRNGERLWKSEVSSIDTALLMGGVLTVRQCYGYPVLWGRSPSFARTKPLSCGQIFEWAVSGIGAQTSVRPGCRQAGRE